MNDLPEHIKKAESQYGIAAKAAYGLIKTQKFIQTKGIAIAAGAALAASFFQGHALLLSLGVAAAAWGGLMLAMHTIVPAVWGTLNVTTDKHERKFMRVALKSNLSKELPEALSVMVMESGFRDTRHEVIDAFVKGEAHRRGEGPALNENEQRLYANLQDACNAVRGVQSTNTKKEDRNHLYAAVYRETRRRRESPQKPQQESRQETGPSIQESPKAERTEPERGPNEPTPSGNNPSV